MKKLKVGDRVTSNFNPNEDCIVRTITFIGRDVDYPSGYKASADGGEYCAGCGRSHGNPIIYVDATWFTKIKE